MKPIDQMKPIKRLNMMTKSLLLNKSDLKNSVQTYRIITASEVLHLY